jgi:hypothetical protein
VKVTIEAAGKRIEVRLDYIEHRHNERDKAIGQVLNVTRLMDYLAVAQHRARVAPTWKGYAASAEIELRKEMEELSALVALLKPTAPAEVASVEGETK